MKIKDTTVKLKLTDKGIETALWVRLDTLSIGAKKKIPYAKNTPKKPQKEPKNR